MNFLRYAVLDRAGLSCVTVALVAASHLVFVPGSAGAQGKPITGIVVDGVGNPIAGAEIGVTGSSSVIRTDMTGGFRFAQSPALPFVIRARRLGFASASIEVAADSSLSSIRLRMTPVAHSLPPVSILPARVAYGGRLGEYYSRLERRSSGVFITREQIDNSNARSLSVILERVPGVQLTRSRHGATVLRLRGRTCRPLVWIDGVAMPSADVDINSFPPGSLHGIEVYFGLSTAPARYIELRDGATCGTILLWSRGPDTEFPPERTLIPWDLERLVNGNAVFTADSVDASAQPDSSQTLTVRYPPPLFAERRRGRVVAEFVVSAEGRVEPHTIGIVSSTHPLFSEAVRETLRVAAYVPAVKAGRYVSQLVHQSFDFNPQMTGDRHR